MIDLTFQLEIMLIKQAHQKLRYLLHWYFLNYSFNSQPIACARCHSLLSFNFRPIVCARCHSLLSFNFQPINCARCHSLLMMFMNLSNIYFLNMEGSDYLCAKLLSLAKL